MYGVDCNIREGGEVGFFVFESEVLPFAKLPAKPHSRSVARIWLDQLLF
jgi:hypothetical protein